MTKFKKSSKDLGHGAGLLQGKGRKKKRITGTKPDDDENFGVVFHVARTDYKAELTTDIVSLETQK